MTQIILLISGKRKSGKDYICEKLSQILGEEKSKLLHISEPLKRCYATDHNLNLTELMSNGPYKEKYRLDMIKWSDEIRSKTPGYFCKATCDEAPQKPVWIVCDIRRKTDIEWFKETFGEKIKTCRISADLNTRRSRGWNFTHGVDDDVSECGLDDFNEWDLNLSNNNSKEAETSVATLLDLINSF